MLLVIAEETNEEELPTWDAFYQKMSHLSIEKLPCENYLFKDYRLESGIAMWILALMTSGRTRHFLKACGSKDEFGAFTYLSSL